MKLYDQRPGMGPVLLGWDGEILFSRHAWVPSKVIHGGRVPGKPGRNGNIWGRVAPMYVGSYVRGVTSRDVRMTVPPKNTGV